VMRWPARTIAFMSRARGNRRAEFQARQPAFARRSAVRE
jgi:hypothetical protein